MSRTVEKFPLTEYEQNGMAFPISVLAAAEVEYFRSESDEMERRLGGKPRTIDVRQMHLHLRWAWDLATHPRVLDAVEVVLGPDILIWATELFAKHPQDAGISIAWHRDAPYLGFNSDASVTAWIALSDSTVENGAMRVLPGHGRDESEMNGNEVVDVVLRAGEMSLHGPDVLHGSAANRSDQKRIGFAIRFATPACTQLDFKSPLVVARGQPTVNGCRIVEPPRDCSLDDALKAMRRSAAEHFETILDNLEHSRR